MFVRAAFFIGQPVGAAHIRMPVRKAPALALSPGLFPGLQYENLRDCHILYIIMAAKMGIINMPPKFHQGIGTKLQYSKYK
jgi:hypothetical protein